ncbi:MAG: GH92 family glycosyl hydrolase [Tannerella sp.]|nr:GH92 family glycosyl hydrolase [Tannerella sp.]
MKKCFLFILCLSGVISCAGDSRNDSKDLAKYVNPMIGASTNMTMARALHGLGKTVPGASTPYGLTQVSPNTITGGDNGPGYSDEHTTMEGFAFTQIGTGWYGDLGNFLVMPTSGAFYPVAGKENDPGIKGYRSHYDKRSEQALAGYYSVNLTDYGIKTEATASPHGGMLRFTFPENDRSRIQIDLARRVGGASTLQYIKVEDNYTIRGWMKCTPDGGGLGDGKGHADYTVFFYARFSKPLADYGFWSADIPDDWKRKKDDVVSKPYLERVAQSDIIRDKKELEGKHLGFFTEFPTSKNEEVILTAGISFVDMEGAEKNYRAELEGKPFDAIRKAAYEQWNNALSVIEVTGKSEEEKVIFYTALYHTMIDPRLLSDVDGRYPGPGNRVHQSTNFRKRTVFSGWDVFRSQFPLQTIINRQLVNDQINSLTTLAEQSGKDYLERWEFFNAYTGCMVGNPAASVLADAYIKGIRDYDVEKAYRYAVNHSLKLGAPDKGFFTESSISNTLEYAYADWCIAQLAGQLGKREDEKRFLERSKVYKNIFDAEQGWFRPKKDDGTWENWPEQGRLKHDYGSVESNPYQQGWFVPHDIEGMVELMGGLEKTRLDLADFFNRMPEDMLWNDYYNHANEPVHHVPFLFNSLGQPWLTQKWTRFICTHGYKNEVAGLLGNEDCGQMSAWYVLAASGIHPVCPGTTRYELTSPVFDHVVIRLENKKQFTITARNNSPENLYIQSATLNGQPYNKCYIDYSDILAGSTLILEMGQRPNEQWGSGE